MQVITFKAFAVANEIDLNRIAVDCGIRKKFTWEEPLILRGDRLAKIIREPVDETQQAMAFSFGSVVFVNLPQEKAMKAFMRYLQTFEREIDLSTLDRYTDDYRMHTSDSGEVELTDEYAVVPEFEPFYPELISTVIAKSVALERIEEQLGRINDKLEGVIERLEKGKLRIGNKELARTTATIVRHEYNTLAYIMILDKPDITWTSSDAGLFYDRMVEFFELNDRYNIMKSKTEVLYHIMEGFSTISHSIRGLFVEWIIVTLIVIEVIITILQVVGVLD
ncbi:RMD1 family protein [Cohnella sp. GCM10027633]|uniref:RMD1 family protein n=1 Tax=unclassified Cohnella TaxID=2636738 RepID=UPI0036267E99